jgi:hypothetical protein
MAETTADVRRDIEMTRERMSDTLEQLEQKVNVAQIVREHPWPALGVALGAGFLLARSGSDVKAAAATVAATGGAGSKLGTLLDDVSARLITGVSQAFNERVDGWVSELKSAIGAPARGDGATAMAAGASARSGGGGARAVDRQMLGLDEGVRRGGTDGLLGTDQPTQDSAAISSSTLAH